MFGLACDRQGLTLVNLYIVIHYVLLYLYEIHQLIRQQLHVRNKMYNLRAVPKVKTTIKGI